MDLEDPDRGTFMISNWQMHGDRDLVGRELWIFRGAERYRSTLFTKNRIKEMSTETLKHMETYINLHIKLDLEVQRLAAFVHKRRRLEASMNKPSKEGMTKDEIKAKVKAIKAQLNDLETQMKPARELVLSTSCSIFLSLRDFPEGKLKDRLYNGRAHNNWLKLHCSERGGCCSDSCKCCSKPREGIDIKGLGHCTSACVCCAERRGREIDTSNGDPHGMKMKVEDLPTSRESLGLVDVFVGFKSHVDFGSEYMKKVRYFGNWQQ